jgi:hypothetical protein
MTRVAVAALVAVLSAAATSCAGDEPPPAGGGGGGGTGGIGGLVDGGAERGDAGGELRGILCAAIDLRDPLECPAADLDGIAVAALGRTAATTSGESGDFALDLAADADHLLAIGEDTEATRDAIAWTGDWQTDDGLLLPTVAQADWDALTGLLSAVEPDDTASIALYVVDQNGPVSGALVIPPDGTGQPPYYDGSSPTAWDQFNLTGSFGATLLFEVPAVSSSVQVEVVADGDPHLVTVRVRPNRLTFARARIEPVDR